MRNDLASRSLIAWSLVFISAASLYGGDARALRTLELPTTPYSYSKSDWPEYFEAARIQAYDTIPETNPITDAGATLGRVLFYDTRLSANGTISCATCHQQSHAFSDPRPVSIGFDGQPTDRNSMALNDLRFVRAGFFWDERADSLEQAVLIPLFSHVEMGMNKRRLLSVLQSDKRYAPLFAAAFGKEEITTEKVSRALAQFIRTMTTCESKYDREASTVNDSISDFSGFTASENLGKRVFFDKCQICHNLGEADQVAIFSMFRSLNNGLDGDASGRDGGRGDVTFNPTENGLFKASSLKNIELTAPYMHDGRMATLEEVVEHYSSGVLRHPNTGAVARFNFSETEQAGLVAFLKTLTDRRFIEDPRFSDPWRPAALLPDADAMDSNGELPTPLRASEDPAIHFEGLKQGRGLPANLTRDWLNELDLDGDGALSRRETSSIAAVLVQMGITQLERGRRRGGRGPARSAATDLDFESRADLDGDGTVTPLENRRFLAVQKLFLNQDGHRLEVLLDRLVGSFRLNVQDANRVRSSLRDAKRALNAQQEAWDQEVIAQLQELLGPQAFLEFEVAVINSQVAVPEQSTDETEQLKAATESIWGYDGNDDGQLDAGELDQLATRLAAFPGGFGQTPPPGISLHDFTGRILAFDVDRDEHISEYELPERMHHFLAVGDANQDAKLSESEIDELFPSLAFSRLVSYGIYIGGGFANTLVHHADILQQIDISQETREAAANLVSQHAERLERAAQETLTSQLLVFKSISLPDTKTIGAE